MQAALHIIIGASITRHINIKLAFHSAGPLNWLLTRQKGEFSLIDMCCDYYIYQEKWTGRYTIKVSRSKMMMMRSDHDAGARTETYEYGMVV